MITNDEKLEEIIATGINCDAPIGEIVEKIKNYWLKDSLIETNITRIEVIGENGREYTRHNVNTKLSFQDDLRTLKIFVDERS
jgi:hypothetical protein